jgi:Domain of unknown function (DUF4845)
MTPARLQRHHRRGRSLQRGITLFGLMFWAMLIGFTAYILIRVLPTVNEYLTIQKTIEKIAISQPTTVAEARKEFERQKEIEYSISSIGGNDLTVTKEDDKVVIEFAYDKLVPLFGPVYLLIKYKGRSQ